MSLRLALLLGLGCLLCGGLAQAQFVVESQEAVYNSVTDNVDFSITFSEPPDFFTVDGFDRQHHSFQYYIDFDTFYDVFSVLIRGGEIHWAGVIPVRDRDGDGGEHSGGWGPIRCTVPFNVSDRTVEFTITRICLADLDGTFSYQIMTTVYGASQGTVTGVSTIATPTLDSTWGQMKALYR